MAKPPVYNSQYQAYLSRQKEKLQKMTEAPRIKRSVFHFKNNPLAKDNIAESSLDLDCE